MRRTRLLSALLIVPALSLALVACSDDGGSSDEDDITAAVEQAATTDEAVNCTEVQTEAFNEQTEFASGAAATKSCQDNAGDGDVAAETVEVENIEVDGEAATADVTFTGGTLDGQEISVSLVKQDDQWKLDRLEEFASFDKDAYAATLIEGASASGQATQAQLDCIEQKISETPDDEIQDIYLSGEEQQLIGLFGDCFSG